MAGNRLYGTSLIFYQINKENKNSISEAIIEPQKEVALLIPKDNRDRERKMKLEKHKNLFSQTKKEKLTEILYYPSSITLISLHPLYSSMKEILVGLYQISQNDQIKIDVPIEHYIKQLVDQIKLPIEENININFHLGEKLIKVNPLMKKCSIPNSEFSLKEILFGKVSFDFIYKLLNAILFESKILFISENQAFLSIFIHLLLQLLHPFRW